MHEMFYAGINEGNIRNIRYDRYNFQVIHAIFSSRNPCDVPFGHRQWLCEVLRYISNQLEAQSSDHSPLRLAKAARVLMFTFASVQKKIFLNVYIALDVILLVRLRNFDRGSAFHLQNLCSK